MHAQRSDQPGRAFRRKDAFLSGCMPRAPQAQPHQVVAFLSRQVVVLTNHVRRRSKPWQPRPGCHLSAPLLHPCFRHRCNAVSVKSRQGVCTCVEDEGRQKSQNHGAGYAEPQRHLGGKCDGKSWGGCPSRLPPAEPSLQDCRALSTRGPPACLKAAGRIAGRLSIVSSAARASCRGRRATCLVVAESSWLRTKRLIWWKKAVAKRSSTGPVPPEKPAILSSIL